MSSQTVVYFPDSAKITASLDSDLTELSFALESVLANFIGRGCASFEFQGSFSATNCVIEAKALGPPSGVGSMVLSKVGNIGYAVQNGNYPRNLTRNFLEEVEANQGHSIVLEGQNKLFTSLTSAPKEKFIESVICSYDFDPRLPLSHITYGLSDMFTGLFAKGVTYLKWQGSMKASQLYVRHTFPERELYEYLMAPQDYELRRKVSTL